MAKASNVKRLPISIYRQFYRAYADAGYQPRPASPGTKECRFTGWNKDVSLVHPPDQPPLEDYGIGLRLGTKLTGGTFLVAIDADRNEFVRLARALVPSPCGRFGSKGIALFARVADACPKFNLKLSDNNKGGEFLGVRHFIMLPPSLHPNTEQPYYWTNTPLLEINPLDLPVVDPDLIREVFASKHLLPLIYARPDANGDWGTHDTLLAFVAQLVNWSDDDGHIERIARATLPEDYDGSSLDELPEFIASAREKVDRGDWLKTNAFANDAPALSEEHLAIEFANRHANDYRYVAKGLGWLIWDGTRWQPDDKKSMLTRARAICREFSRKANRHLRRVIASARTRMAVVSLSQDDERIAASADQWDSDLWVLNTPGGTVDLKTGRLREHRRDDYITKCTAVTPDPACPTPLWSAFLARVMAGDRDLQDYLQRACGYTLTGVTTEHACSSCMAPARTAKAPSSKRCGA
jgi:hypothetical protein